MSKLKDGLKRYGRTGVVVYLAISFSVTAGWYVAIERNVDVKKLLGMKEDPDKEPTWMETVLLGKGSNFALAILASKMLVPLKLPLAITLTPYVQRWQERLMRGWIAGRKSS
ncbi:hypothetical protein FOA52_006796 [Chlamydomonas sp. UWO 241]|nr:hypothetical protein FOA52_006796 [Chlamydomonas sp. UWO 241]